MSALEKLNDEFEQTLESIYVYLSDNNVPESTIESLKSAPAPSSPSFHPSPLLPQIYNLLKIYPSLPPHPLVVNIVVLYDLTVRALKISREKLRKKLILLRADSKTDPDVLAKNEEVDKEEERVLVLVGFELVRFRKICLLWEGVVNDMKNGREVKVFKEREEIKKKVREGLVKKGRVNANAEEKKDDAVLNDGIENMNLNAEDENGNGNGNVGEGWDDDDKDESLEGGGGGGGSEEGSVSPAPEE